MNAQQVRAVLLRSWPELRLVVAQLAGVLVFLGSLLIYGTTLTHAHTYDALSYALAVDERPWQELFHPHHLAYGPLGALMLGVSRLAGWQGSAVIPMQITNALAGALGVALFFELARAITRRLDLALCGALLLGGSYAYWYYAVEVEVYTIAAVLLIVCLWLLVCLLRAPDVRVSMALGAVQGMAILFHQTNVLLCVPVAVVLLLATRNTQPHDKPYASWRLWLAYALPLGLIVGGAYLLAGFGFSRFRSVGELIDWVTLYPRTGWWGGSITEAKWAGLATGLSSSLAHPAGALSGLLLLGLLLLYARHMVERYGRLVLCLGSWLLCYGLFFFWWEPENAEFWIASYPPAVLLLVLALSAAGRRGYPGVVLALTIGLTMIVGNYHAIMLRGSGAYAPQLPTAQALGELSEPDDLVLVADGLQDLYLQYYAGHDNVVSLTYFLQDSEGDWDAACTRMRQRIERSLARGAAVFIGDEVLEPALITTRYNDPVLERFLPEQDNVNACLAAYTPDLTPITLGATLPTYYRLPAATELLAGDGWDFDHSRWGWRAGNARDQQFELYDTDAVWSFIPEPDPYLISPSVPIDTDRYWAVQVRLGKGVSNREAQLFFMDEAGTIEETRSVRWELANHADLKTYHLDMRQHPEWRGTIYGLRLDPSTGPDEDVGERVYIAWLRLLSYEDDPPDPAE